jgi:hypothetical protein
MAAAVNLLPMFRWYYESFKEEVDKNSVPFRFDLRLMAEKLVEVGVGNGVKVAAKQVIDNIDQGKDLVEQRNILIGILRDELDDRGAMEGGRKRRVKRTRKTGGRSTRSRKGRLTTQRRKGGRAVEGPRKTWKQLADELKKMVREVPQDQKKYTVEEFAKRLERANIVDPTPNQQSQSDLFVTAMAFEVPALARVAYDRGARDDEQAARWEETLAEARNSDSPPEYVPVLREILSIMRPQQTPAQ